MASKSVWRRYSVLDKVLDILTSETNSRDSERRYGYPFLSAYQLAILLDEQYPEIRQALDERLGGPVKPGEPNRDSLAHYLGRELSKGISAERITTIEKANLSGTYRNISFKSEEGVIEAVGKPLAMFRYRPQR